MRRTAVFGLALGLTISMAAPLVAKVHKATDPGNLCGKKIRYADLVGVYTMTLGTSTLTAPGFPGMTRPTKDVITATLALVGRQLTLTGMNVDATLAFVSKDEPDWRWGTKLSQITSGDIEVTAGCALERLPRLVGTGSGQSQEGDPLAYDFRLVVIQHGWLYGRMRWHARGMTMTRSMTLEEKSQ